MKWKLSLFLILGFWAGRCDALTLSDLLVRTRVFLKDTAASSSRQTFSDALLTNFLNDSQKEVNLRTFAVVSSTRFPLISGTTEYNLPSSEIVILRVTVDHTALPERTFSFLDDAGTSWVEDSTGAVREYYIRTSSSLVAGVSRESIGFHPRSSSGEAIADFLAQPADLSAPSDVPFGSDNRRLYPFHQILAYRAAYLGYIAMGDIDMASVYLREYEALIPVLEAVTKNRLEYNPNLRGNISVAAPAPAQAAQQ